MMAGGKSIRRLALGLLFIGCGATWSMAGGPCDPPPFDPLVPVSSVEQVRRMDRWAVKALRRDVRGRTCPGVREVVDILLVRWLQAHPDIHIAFDGAEAQDLLQSSDRFLRRIKAEAWAETKGRRGCFPRSWGGEDVSVRSLERRAALVERTLDRLEKS